MTSKNKFVESELIPEEKQDKEPIFEKEEKPVKNAISVRAFLSNNRSIRRHGKYVLVAFQRYCSLEKLFVLLKTEKEWISVYEKFAKRKVV